MPEWLLAMSADGYCLIPRSCKQSYVSYDSGDAEYSPAMNAKLIGSESGLRKLTAMSGSLKSCFKKLFDKLPMVEDLQVWEERDI